MITIGTRRTGYVGAPVSPASGTLAPIACLPGACLSDGIDW